MASSLQRLAGRIALITGASRGIGAAVAKRFAAEGAQLILTARTVGGLEETDDAIKSISGTNATLVPFDLKEHVKIAELAKHVAARHGKLDILVGNAAMLGPLTPLAHANDDMWKNVIDINLTANFHLLKRFDPLLQASGSGRAIFVTSGVTQSVFPYWGAYSVSKTALECLVKTYAAEVSKTGVKANIIDPGIVRTKMRKEAFPGEDPSSLPDPDSITDRFVELAEAGYAKSGVLVGV